MRVICTICRKPPFETRMESDMPQVSDRCERTITDDERCRGKYINVLTDADKEQRGQISLMEIL